MRLAHIVTLLIVTGCAASRTHPRASAVPAVPALRVMSYNIQSGAGNLERTAGVIRDEHPDVVALQEVDVHWAERSRFADQARELATRLKMDVRFAPIYHIASPEPDRPAREFGVALLSRLSVVSWRNDTLTRLSTQEAN